MSEAALAAQRAEDAALNARCAANPREAANYAALLRRTPHAKKECCLLNNALDNNATLGNLSVLHFAAEYGAFDVVRLLLEAGADANSCDDLKNVPLVSAICRGQLACARELIPHTDLRIYNSNGLNMLHASIVANEPEIFKLLLPHFADNVDVRTIKPRPPANPDGPYGNTPLHLACKGGHHAMVKALLAAGASRTAHNSNSVSCLHKAASGGHLACVTMLIGRPGNQKMSAAEIDAHDGHGQTAIHLAAANGHRYCCAALLAAGADPAVVTHTGGTALDAAKYYHPGNQELIKLLECRGGGPAPLLCAGCGASDKRLRACSACGSVSFCSNACMAQFWSVHKAECKRIQAEKEEKARSRTVIHKY